MTDDTQQLNQIQFGQNAQNFVNSQTHASGYSLDRLVEIVVPQAIWRVLDVATGGGHTALAFSRHVNEVIATDLTYPMLRAAQAHITRHGASNVCYSQVDSSHLPFPDASFDCVTCRIAPHHFSDVGAFVLEAARILRAGGTLAIADNIVSGDARTARLVNTVEKFRDPSHQWAYTLDDWETYYFSAHLDVRHIELVTKETDVDEWASRIGMVGDDLTRLKALLLNAPAGVRDWFAPRQVGNRILFTVSEALIVGTKALA